MNCGHSHTTHHLINSLLISGEMGAHVVFLFEKTRSACKLVLSPFRGSCQGSAGEQCGGTRKKLLNGTNVHLNSQRLHGMRQVLWCKHAEMLLQSTITNAATCNEPTPARPHASTT
eukprot:TRINITY_DN83153_c0_g1_i1.p1 TRINITY_DN83153_c0_g1~~TRINITY_DN83153_c0_g1_i1.p1  ORF type:complete len:116 (+),score=5.54 TRINITY_DN83153_c0_g1_i1:42-389(+)